MTLLVYVIHVAGASALGNVAVLRSNLCASVIFVLSISIHMQERDADM